MVCFLNSPKKCLGQNQSPGIWPAIPMTMPPPTRVGPPKTKTKMERHSSTSTFNSQASQDMSRPDSQMFSQGSQSIGTWNYETGSQYAASIADSQQPFTQQMDTQSESL